MAIGRNRSGIDSGEIDYTLMYERFEKQSIGSLEDIIITLKVLIKKCDNRIIELEVKE